MVKPSKKIKRKVRVGIIGIGNMGSIHANTLLQHKIHNAELTALCDIDPIKLDKYNGVLKFTNSNELLNSKSVDAVIIATPHYSHTTIGILALGKGLHVLVEKPISVHKRDAQKLLSAHKNSKQIFSVMFQLRTEPTYQKIYNMIHNEQLGKLQRINWIITDVFRSETYYASGGWRATWKGEGGGVMLNQCPHNLDLWQWLFGMPKYIQGFCHLGKYHDIEVEDEVTAYMEYANGITGVFIATTGEAPGSNRLEIAGDKGKLVLENGKITLTMNNIPTRQFSKTTNELFGKPLTTLQEIQLDGKGGQHPEIIQNFMDAIISNKPLISPAKDGLHSVELANAILYSSLKNRTVKLPLNGKDFEQELLKLIRTSRLTKKKTKNVIVDMTKSFQR